MNWKHWVNLLDKISDVKNRGVIHEDSYYFGLSLPEYFLLNRAMHYTLPKHVMWVGGFSNLDFFISQEGVDTVKKCTNIDPTPASDWCARKHKQFAEEFGYKGEYIFMRERFDNQAIEDVEFMWMQGDLLSQVDLRKMTKLKTLVVDYYGHPWLIDSIKKTHSDLPRRIITNNIAIYTRQPCTPLMKDIWQFNKMANHKVCYRTSDNNLVDDITTHELEKDNFEMFITKKPLLSWEKRIEKVHNDKNKFANNTDL
jgi:hypothetical protein